MFSVLVPIMMEFFKYQSGQVIREKFQMTQEQIQKTVQEQITKILIKFFGGLICTVTLCYSLIGLLDLFQSYINTLAYATEIKIVFFVIVLTSAVLGLKTIFVDKKLNSLQTAPIASPSQTSNQPDFNIMQNIVSQFIEGLNEGMADSRKKKSPEEKN
jgi:succinate dehydrogenase hydrophobic anchor subunit